MNYMGYTSKEIYESVENNEYDHTAATYYLLRDSDHLSSYRLKLLQISLEKHQQPVSVSPNMNRIDEVGSCHVDVSDIRSRVVSNSYPSSPRSPRTSIRRRRSGSISRMFEFLSFNKKSTVAATDIFFPPGVVTGGAIDVSPQHTIQRPSLSKSSSKSSGLSDRRISLSSFTFGQFNTVADSPEEGAKRRNSANGNGPRLPTALLGKRASSGSMSPTSIDTGPGLPRTRSHSRVFYGFSSPPTPKVDFAEQKDFRRRSTGPMRA